MRTLLVSWAVLGVLMSTWAITSPLRSAPDEPSHVIRAVAAAHGELVARGNGYFDVPAYYAPGFGPCFATKPTVTPTCVQAAPDPDRDAAARATAFVNSPVYYVLVGWPSLLLSGDAAVYAMRVVSAILSAGLVALAFAVLQRRRSPWAMVGLAVAMTPSMLFLGGSVNPNAMEAAGAAALLVCLEWLVRQSARGGLVVTSSVGVVLGVVAAASGRMFGLIWVAVIPVIVALLLSRDDWSALVRRRSAWVVLGASALVVAGTILWFQRPVLEGDPNPLNLQTPLSVAFVTIDSTFEYWAGMIGLFGWLDAPAPDLTIVIWNSLILGGLVAGIVLSRGRERIAVVGMAVTLLLVPVALQVALYPRLGFLWQGRYMLAALCCALILAGMALDSRDRGRYAPSADDPVGGMLRAAVILVAVGHAGAFLWALRRYAVGTDSIVDTFLNPEWQPPLGSVGSAALFTAVLAASSVVAWRAVGTWRKPALAPDAANPRW